MANRNAYRRKWLRWQKTYEKRASKELRKVFKTWAESIDWSLINSSNFEDEIGKSFDIELLNDAYLRIYTDIGLVHGDRVGKSINLQLKVFSPGDFLTSYMDNIVRYLQTFAGKRIVTVRKSFIKYIVDVIRDEFFQDYDLFDATDSILDVVDEPEKVVSGTKFYRWQAERIARTESIGAANYAALEAAEISGYVMVKEWISAHDKRTRSHNKGDLYDHVEKDGERIPLRAEFIFNEGDDKLQFPGDPTGEPGNVINCRCTIAPIPARDINGNLISNE